ncbi:MAG: TetR family transcriptional regulator [Umezawaea sp.]
MVCTPTFLRARRPAHKQQRYDASRAAARELALLRGVRSVSLGDIAAEVGVHKSGILRYFETREEIYLLIGAECWHEWSTAVHAELDGATGARALADGLSKTLAERPLFCDLLAHAPMTLERHVSPGAVREFKLAALEAVDSLSALAVRVVPEIDEDRGFEVISAVGCFAATAWQVSHPPEALAALYAEDPKLAKVCVDFVPAVSRFARVYIAGLVSGVD